MVSALSAVGCATEEPQGSGDDGRAVAPSTLPAEQGAGSISLGLSDLPPGWQAGPAEQGDRWGLDDLGSCLEVDFSQSAPVEVESRDFSFEAAEISFTSHVLASKAQAQESAELHFAMISSEAPGCLEDAMIEALGGPNEPPPLEFKVDVLARPLKVMQPRRVSIASGVEFEVRLALQDESRNLYMNSYVFQEGNVVSEIATSSKSIPFDLRLFDHLLQAVADRMR